MILIDHIIRYFKRDVYLPKRCFATTWERMHPCGSCKCRLFCKAPPQRGVPVYIPIKQ